MKRAFTLVEILLAIVLIMAISGAMFVFLWGLSARRDLMLTSTVVDNAASVMIEELEAHLASTFVVGGDGKPGVNGESVRIAVLSRGVNATGDDADLSDLQGCEFRFETRTGSVRGKRLAGEFSELGGTFERVQFRYYDGREWLSSFDSAAKKTLPVAVEVQIWHGQPASDEDVPEPPLETPGPEIEPAGQDLDPFGSLDDAPQRSPDIVRVIVVPDGPVTSWKEGG